MQRDVVLSLLETLGVGLPRRQSVTVDDDVEGHRDAVFGQLAVHAPPVEQHVLRIDVVDEVRLPQRCILLRLSGAIAERTMISSTCQIQGGRSVRCRADTSSARDLNGMTVAKARRIAG